VRNLFEASGLWIPSRIALDPYGALLLGNQLRERPRVLVRHHEVERGDMGDTASKAMSQQRSQFSLFSRRDWASLSPLSRSAAATMAVARLLSLGSCAPIALNAFRSNPLTADSPP
jgi:hypothetical protein